MCDSNGRFDCRWYVTSGYCFCLVLVVVQSQRGYMRLCLCTVSLFMCYGTGLAITEVFRRSAVTMYVTSVTAPDAAGPSVRHIPPPPLSHPPPPVPSRPHPPRPTGRRSVTPDSANGEYSTSDKHPIARYIVNGTYRTVTVLFEPFKDIFL